MLQNSVQPARFNGVGKRRFGRGQNVDTTGVNHHVRPEIVIDSIRTLNQVDQRVHRIEFEVESERSLGQVEICQKYSLAGCASQRVGSLQSKSRSSTSRLRTREHDDLSGLAFRSRWL